MKRLSRRQMLGAGMGLGLGAALLKTGAGSAPRASASNISDPHHLIWVWQFTTDAAPNLIGEKLRDHNLGIVIKTHDGTQWMAEYDKSPFAISGAPQVGTLANYYEGIGVPFHAWTVVHGTDPKREAQMAAEVLEAGARSIYLDVEPYAGFWRGTPADAEAFGKELRRLSPNGRVVLCIDSRPWTLERLPIKQFVAFSDAIAPQNYWRTFNTPANYTRFNETGFPVGNDGVTPEFLLKMSTSVLGKYGLPIIQVGQGATPDSNEMRRFIDGAYSDGADYVTVWRYGVTGTDVFNLLKDMPAKVPPPPVVAAASGATGVYVVVEGDTVGAIAARFGTSVEAIMQANSMTDASYIYVGQQLQIPGLAGAVTATAASTNGGGSKTYTVVDGDTLYGIAGKYGTSADAIVSLNGLADPNSLSIGQELKIP